MPPVEKPNYTQIPNVILDNMASMTSAEFSVVMAICRQTFGWHKKSEKLSVTQIEQLTGLSAPTVRDGIAAALKDGWITRRPAGQTYVYRVHIHEVDGKKLSNVHEVDGKKLDQSRNLTPKESLVVTPKDSFQVPSKNLSSYTPTLKKGKETNSKESSKEKGAVVVVAQVKTQAAPAPAIQIFEELCERKPNQQQHQAILAAVTDCAKWRTVLTDWLMRGYGPSNVVGQLDVYANGWQHNGNKPTVTHEPPPTRRMTQPIFAKEQP